MEIAENCQEHFKDFIRLNEEWISTYFEIEEIDRKLAANPQKVIDDGGFIYSLLLEKEVVGVCSLFNKGYGIYELARMAVSPNYQGRGYGNQLIKNCFSKAKILKAKRIVLVSNTKLVAAISLYKKHGFKTISIEQHPVYERANITMEYDVSGYAAD